MPTIKLPEFTQEELDIIHISFGNLYGYQATVQDPKNPQETIINPQSIEDFMSDKIAGFIDNAVFENANRQALAGVTHTEVVKEKLETERAEAKEALNVKDK